MGFWINQDQNWNSAYSTAFFSVTRFTPPSSKQSVTISKWPNLATRPPIEQAVKEYSEPEEGEKMNYTLTGTGILEVSGNPAGVISYKSTAGDTVFSHPEYLVQTKDHLYLLDYSAGTRYYDQYGGLFKQMASSFVPL